MSTTNAFFVRTTQWIHGQFDRIRRWPDRDKVDAKSGEDVTRWLLQTYAQTASDCLRQVEQLSISLKQATLEKDELGGQVATLTRLLENHLSDARTNRGRLGQLTSLFERLDFQVNACGAEPGSTGQPTGNVLEKFKADLATLRQIILTGEMTAPLQAELRRAHREAALANHLLAAIPELRRDTRQWLPLPKTIFQIEDSNIHWKLEQADCDRDLTRIGGWACPEDAQAVHCGLPALLAIGANRSWIVAGQNIERPDVLSALPDGRNREVSNRLSAGFLFELGTDHLPAGILEWRLIRGIVDRPPIVTPAFRLK